MAENSGIEWTDDTFNHVIGCAKVAPGCANCYAEEMMDARFGQVQWGPNGTRVRTSDANWRKPLAWNRAAEKAGVPRKVFCASLADVFEDWQGAIVDHTGEVLGRAVKSVSRRVVAEKYSSRTTERITMDDMRRDLFAMIDQTPWLRWLLLTKRPQNVRRMWPSAECVCEGANYSPGAECDHHPQCPARRSFRPNVLLGTSISDQATADAAIPELLKCRDLCAGLFVSLEPMLGAVDLMPYIGEQYWFCQRCYTDKSPVQVTYEETCTVCGEQVEWHGGIDWVIIGCESAGPRVGRLGAFERESAWWNAAANLVWQCRDADVAVFVKQGPRNGRVVHDLEAFPAECRVREFPECIAAPASV